MEIVTYHLNKVNNTVYVTSLGSGPDLVLLHGWAMHHGIWNNIRDQLATNFRVHLVDLPGHGLSPACSPSSLQGITAAITTILPDDSIVCGWSLGGLISIELATQQSVKIKKLVLVASTPCFVKRSNWQLGIDAAVLQQFKQNLKDNYQSTINRFLTLQLNGSKKSSSVLTQLKKNFYQYSQPDLNMLKAGLNILLTSDLRKKIPHIKQPVILLHGQNDVISPACAAIWMHQQLPNSTLKLFPHCGHAPFLTYPDQFISALHEQRSYSR